MLFVVQSGEGLTRVPTGLVPAERSVDPDGNTWAVQELKVRAQKPLIPVEARGRFGA
jgi:hypothetical protein